MCHFLFFYFQVLVKQETARLENVLKGHLVLLTFGCINERFEIEVKKGRFKPLGVVLLLDRNRTVNLGKSRVWFCLLAIDF